MSYLQHNQLIILGKYEEQASLISFWLKINIKKTGQKKLILIIYYIKTTLSTLKLSINMLIVIFYLF